MTNEQPVEKLMRSTMENLRSMIDVNTVIGDAVETRDGTYIIPVSKLSFGFASGGAEYSTLDKNFNGESNFPFGGGSGAGVSVKPVAFLVVKEDGIRMIPVDQDSTYDRIVDSVPQVIDMAKDLIKEMKNKNKSAKHGNNTNIDLDITENLNTSSSDTTDD
ncbi:MULTISPECIES: GerW family sporulation protein [Clostridium]|uniref:GerW family sporulation protein n=1 Tax=Clostridium aquiflavi TaxID=3073603 RepID=A0ABU1EGI2_9CLOT|nr:MULTISPECIES: GerW family sporulation protein [unclassified Clostridium]MDR5587273.1 GerW family sporulation protein [Clostridium sp. 5N-1]NFG62198.1 sporulation protein YtfJ [Clostridium botulinum]NFQ09560.1 sporulation protein YtfJ [Clostridium botulinum]